MSVDFIELTTVDRESNHDSGKVEIVIDKIIALNRNDKNLYTMVYVEGSGMVFVVKETKEEIKKKIDKLTKKTVATSK